MAEYYADRRLIRELFEIPIVPDKIKAMCAIYERWEFRRGFDCKCGNKVTLKLVKTEGLSATASATLQGTIESSLGVSGFASLKASLQATLGLTVNWSQAQTEEFTYECDPPECGSCDIAIYQLVREYDLAVYKRGGFFKTGIWDRKGGASIPELTGFYTEVTDRIEQDEKCKCSPREVRADYDGRVSVDFGNICILAPYRLTQTGIDIRIAKQVISFPFFEQHKAMDLLETGLRMNFQREWLPAESIFYGKLEGDVFEAVVRIYRDPGSFGLPLPEGTLEGSPSSQVAEPHKALSKLARKEEVGA